MSEPSAGRRSRAPTRSRDLVGWSVDTEARLAQSYLTSYEEMPEPTPFERKGEKAEQLNHMVLAIVDDMHHKGSLITVADYIRSIEQIVGDMGLDPTDLFTAIMSQYRLLFPEESWYEIRANLQDQGVWEIDWDMPGGIQLEDEFVVDVDTDTDVEDSDTEVEEEIYMYDPIFGGSP